MRHDRIDPEQNSTRPGAEDWEPDMIGKAHADTGAVVRERSERTAPVAAGDPWLDIKSRFVDDPAGAVADAEQLVRQAVDERVRELQDEAAAVYAHDDEDASTEGLRNRMVRYQAYCQRLAGSALH
jgi:hypothetical protein